MTVINAMRFSNTSGGMVADEESSNLHTARKYDLVEKVKSFSSGNGTFALIGGSGSSDLLYESRVRLGEEYSGGEFSVKDLANGLSEIMTNIKRERIERHLKEKFGISGLEALTGQRFIDGMPLQIGSHLLKDVAEDYEGKGMDFNNVFLMIGRDGEKGAVLYYVPMGGNPFLSSRPYMSVGSGSDESDKVLSHFFKRLKREDRGKILVIDGMTALIRATAASSDFNIGVGGVPAISYFDDGGVKTLGEENSRMAVELVRLHDAGLLGKNAIGHLAGLLDGSTNYRNIENLLKKEKSYSRISSFLRGYKE